MTDQEKFLQKLAAAAPIRMDGLYTSVMLAQSALESGWGKSELTRKYNNYFGILADSSWKGDRVKFSNGFTYRAYNSVRESIQDYIKFLNDNSRYRKAGVFNAASPEDEARALQAAGYAGINNTTYAGKIISIINTYNLKRYDTKKKSKIFLIAIPVLLLLLGTGIKLT